MPPGGAEHRGKQLSLLARFRRELLCSPQMLELLEAIEGSGLAEDPDSAAAINLRELKRGRDRRLRVPKELTTELIETAAKSQREWALAYKTSDWDRFRPWLERIVSLKRAEAQALARPGEPYDGLLDDYERGMTAPQLEVLFEGLRAALVPLLDRIKGSPRQPKVDLLRGSYPVPAQRLFVREVAEMLGYDFATGRIDETVHPFCARVGHRDTRIATRFNASDFTQGLFAVLHEVGHAFYEQGLSPEHLGTPFGDTCSLGVHESQSRLWENCVGRSRPFWEHLLPMARLAFPGTLQGARADEVYAAINRVSPTFVRAEADEVTYNLHVLIRFELERALINGHLAPAELPEAWNDCYRRYLGIEPPTATLGCLQDGHWASGLFGYFPTYTLGNLFAAQIFQTAEKEVEDLGVRIARGELSALREWLRLNVHSKGRSLSSARLIESITGMPPTQEAFVARLERKYGEIYAL